MKHGKKLLAGGALALVMTSPAFAAFDYSALDTAIKAEVTAGLAFASGLLATVLAAYVGLKVAKNFAMKAT